MNKELLTKVYTLASQGLYASKIAKALNMDKSHVSYYIHVLTKKGNLVQATSWPKTYKVKTSLTTSDEVSTLQKKTVRSEHYQIKIPIIHDNPDFVGTRQVKDGFGRWMRKYAEGDFPFDVTLEKTPKSVILHCHQKHFLADRNFISQLTVYTAKLLNYFTVYMRNKGVTVDITKARVISQEMEMEMPEYDDKVEPSAKVTIKTGDQAQSVLGPMSTSADKPVKAKAWLDRSNGPVEIGSNDLTYEEKLLMMPMTVEKLEQEMAFLQKTTGMYAESIKLYDEQIRKHLGVLSLMEKTLAKMEKKMDTPSKTKSVQTSLNLWRL